MRRLILAVVLALAPSLAFADFTVPPAVFPVVPARATTLEGFVPAGWKLEFSARGDLNADGKADAALVIRQTSARNIIRGHGLMGEDPFNSNPRMLVIVFARADGAGFDRVLENHVLIQRREVPAQSDPLEDAGSLKIARGAVQVRLNLFMSAGGWGTSNTTYTFRYQGGRFMMIGFDRTELQRNTGESVLTSVNYLTRKARIANTNMETERETSRWVNLPPAPLLTLADIGDGLEYEPRLR